MIPKLYLIESDEQKGLVKLGYTNRDGDSSEDVVYMRIKDYRAGISHTSTVYETPGAPTFEDYFHTFIDKTRKPIHIKFKLTGKVMKPREWFTLPSNIAKIFIQAFSKKHPTSIDEVSIDDLPIFLSGALSAIHWHAQHVSVSELAEMTARLQLSSKSLETQVTGQIKEYNQEPLATFGRPEEQLISGLEHEDSHVQQDTDPESTLHPLPPGFVQALAQIEGLKIEMEEMQEMEATRTLIALAAIAMIFFLLMTGAAIAGCLFAIFAGILYAAWPSLQPFLASTSVDLANYLKTRVKKSRRHTSRYDD